MSRPQSTAGGIPRPPHHPGGAPPRPAPGEVLPLLDRGRALVGLGDRRLAVAPAVVDHHARDVRERIHGRSPCPAVLAHPVHQHDGGAGTRFPDGEPGGAQLRPSRASRTRVTASGNTAAITARSCCACSSVVPWMFARFIAATVRSTASLIALSAHASFCWPCICSANSAMRRCIAAGSPKSPPKPSMASILGGRRPFRTPGCDDLPERPEAEHEEDRD